MKTSDADTIERFIRMVEDIPDEQLAVVIQEADAEWKNAKSIYDRATFEMRKRLEQAGEGRRVMPNGDLVELVDPATEYEWDIDALQAIKPLLAPGEWGRLVWSEEKTIWHFNTRSLNALAKKAGGRLQELVEAACTRKPKGEAKVAIKRGEGNGSIQSPTPIRGFHN